MRSIGFCFENEKKKKNVPKPVSLHGYGLCYFNAKTSVE